MKWRQADELNPLIAVLNLKGWGRKLSCCFSV